MKILAIRGRNLASLAGDFEIDFQCEPLASTGLFAICGPTGAGKSTLLDALCLALFDDTPRLRGADGRGVELPDVGAEKTLPNDRRNILRRGCAEGYAEVDFRGNDGIGYRARWSVRRARARAEGKLQASEMALERLDDAQPVAGRLKSEVLRAIAERIGLSFDQFTRAVLLAQNEFFAFLKAGEDERAALLQTLTGTDRFEVLSRRAFERNKREQETLRALELQLGQQQPLTADARAGIEAQRVEANAALARHEALVKRLERQLQWHRELAAARERELRAQAGLDRAASERDAAIDRRAELARVEAVQPARPLLADVERLAVERGRAAAAAVAAAAAMDAATRDADAAREAAKTADDAVAALDAERARLRPLVARARELDNEIATLAPEHAKAARAHDEAALAHDAARRELRRNEDARADAASRLASAQAWLQANARLAPLADGWIKWNALLESAADERRGVVGAQADVERLTRQSAAQVAALQQAVAQRTDAAEALARQEAGAADAAKLAAGFEADALAREAAEVEAQQQQVRAAAQARGAASTLSAQLDESAQQCAALRAALADNGARLAQVLAAMPVAEAARAEAERAWTLVFEATQASVEALRAQLRPHDPCPVCGGVEHPYATGHAAFDDALAKLSENRNRCRDALNQLRVEQQTLAKDSASREADLAALLPRFEALREKQAAAARDWRSAAARLVELFPQRPLPSDGDAAGTDAWLIAQETALDERRRAIAEREAACRAAHKRLRDAREALDASRGAETRARDAAQQRQADADRTAAALRAASDAQAQAAARLDALLARLEDAHDEPDWRAAWHADPDAHRARCARMVADWQAYTERAASRQADIAKLDAESDGLRKLVEQAGTQQARAAAELAARRADLEARQTARREVFAGVRLPAACGELAACATEALTPSAIDTAFAAADERAKQQAAACARAATDAVAQLASRRATLAALSKQVSALSDAAQDAQRGLDDWLAAFDGARVAAGPGECRPLDAAALHELLARDAAWIAGERDALQRLDSAVAAASGGLAQTRLLCEAHERARPADELPVEDAPEPLHTALAASNDEAKTLRAALGALDLQLARDDDVRRQAAQLVEAIAAQTQAARIWAQMNELIGAADGKKFRNYAQQLTLDVLLGYANAHLADLARRYRLSRVPNSLALMVVDRDMGDESRSVHSLSGGESFLVSLALALGLASLSSHRVRVESLFIDEGFGSLDADTLRVAMDALDRLQAMGRKVGVISHVEEMTERISTRIQVKRLPGGQSRVVVTNAF